MSWLQLDLDIHQINTTKKPRKVFHNERMKTAFKRNVKEYADRSSIHGISYIFDHTLAQVDRVLWLVATLCGTGLALWMIATMYLSWQENQVITTLKTTTKSVTTTEFPAITICTGGLHMHLVEKVLYENFKQWKDEASNKTSEDEFSSFMEEKYQIKDKGLNILDILNTMISPKAGETNIVTQNQLACEKRLPRKKRETVPG